MSDMTMIDRWKRGAARRAAIVLLAAGASCAGPHIEARPGGVVTRSDRIGWYRKKVVTKRAPETLLAEDGTLCRVAPDRFANTRVGDVVYCNWQ